MNKTFFALGLALVSGILGGCAAGTEESASEAGPGQVAASEFAPACKQTLCAYRQALRQESCGRCQRATERECSQYQLACDVPRACAASCEPITCSAESMTTCHAWQDAE